jgi:hypothetical protein
MAQQLLVLQWRQPLELKVKILSMLRRKERKDIMLIIVLNCGGSLNVKEGIQDFPIRTQG